MIRTHEKRLIRFRYSVNSRPAGTHRRDEPMTVRDPIPTFAPRRSVGRRIRGAVTARLGAVAA
ncbi:hypothetical protein DM2_2945 [Halorubrum sp. DM2]|nr:hypothetical protein BN903_68 [Halorubrum sp. AJ67]VTT86907.1 hypothetical protein DM2_2945 [Halorubrum sp. DM2]